MSDQRKFTLLAGTGVLLVLLVMAYGSFPGSPLSSFVEASKRQRHYEQVIQKKGLTLHEGAFWKTKE
jgi:cell division septal protein FtsQ